MAEARKCDRCHGFYDIVEEQQDRETPYEFKGDYVNLHLWVARNGIRKDVMSQWYDLCPKCMMVLENWLANPDDWKPEDCLTTVDNEYNKAIAGIKTYKKEDKDCADRSNGATEREIELAAKLNEAKIYIAQLKSELGYTMTKEEIEMNNKKLISPTNEIECPYTKCNECGRFKEECHELIQFKYFVCERYGKAIHEGYQIDEITPEIIKKDGIKIQKGDEDIQKGDEDPCNGCPNPHCEQCEYGYKSEEVRKELYKKNKEEK